MVSYYIILLIILIVIAFLYYRYSRNHKPKTKQPNPSGDRFTDNNLIKSIKCSEQHPSAIHLYLNENDKQIINVWNNLIKQFDPKTYAFSKITDHKIQTAWGIDKIPCMRAYGASGMCDPKTYTEYKGMFDMDSMKKFIIEQ